MIELERQDAGLDLAVAQKENVIFLSMIQKRLEFNDAFFVLQDVIEADEQNKNQRKEDQGLKSFFNCFRV